MEQLDKKVVSLVKEAIQRDTAIARVIKEDNQGVKILIDDSKESRAGLRALSAQMASLVRSVEQLTGQAITAAQRDKCQC